MKTRKPKPPAATNIFAAPAAPAAASPAPADQAGRAPAVPGPSKNWLDLASLLNETQLKAATHPGGPLLIVAGAGTGKTRTLVHRVAWLIERGADPASILLLTFTRKAAGEMLGRCQVLVGPRAGGVAGGTFHSLANSLLRRHAPALGYSDGFTIMDQDDSVSLISKIRSDDQVFRQAGFPKTKTLQGVFSQAVNKEMTIIDLVRSSYPHLINFCADMERFRQAYAGEKLANDLMDFDDLLVQLERLLLQNEEVRLKLARKYSHILVDEYQDTNPVQARLAYLLGKDHRNVTAVGDEAQSIYSFRGANFRNIMDFPRIFPDATILKLEDNYRSSPQILRAANSLMAQAREKFQKVLRPHRDEGPLPEVRVVDELSDEAETVCSLVREDLSQGIPLSEMAVLFRSGFHSFELETVLARAGLPFSKFGGRKFMELAHNKDFQAYLRLALKPGDAMSLRRCLGHLPGLGAKGVEAVSSWALALDDYAPFLAAAPGVMKKAREGLKSLGTLLGRLQAPGAKTGTVVGEAHEYYAKLLPALYPDDFPGRQTELLEFRAMAVGQEDLGDFLASLSLEPPETSRRGGVDGEGRDDLTLSTVHSAKGLEWRRVYILSVVEGRFPSAYSRRQEDVEEELRLMYVAVTRAKEKLVMTAPRHNAQDPGNDHHPNRFLAGLAGGEVALFVDGEPTGDLALLVKNRGGFKWAGDNPDPAPVTPTVPSGRYKHEPARQPSLGYVSKINHPLVEGRETVMAAKKKVKNPGPPPAQEGLETGGQVRHPFFGIGRIVGLFDNKAKIDFEAFGLKTLVTNYAKLEKLDG
ncbi:MAG: ATP-dependent helicase [Deltaproteobacteria bacterium]|jgi:DNA helicase-2/ATP-dependent DNA helicase PcrA|nr:ATP-dependent helicase [Deltaproteobacteria bacterium]